MTTTTTTPDEFTVLDQLIARALVTLRLARAACAEHGTQKDLDLRIRAEENLDALLDFRYSVAQRPTRDPAPTLLRAAERLPT
jgi:hypothetical protein